MIKKLLNSLDNSSEGYSARKLTALTLTICIVYIHWKYVDLSIAIEAMIVDLVGVLVALGIVTAEQVIKFKNGTNNGADSGDSGSGEETKETN